MTFQGFVRQVAAAQRRAVRNAERMERLQARAAKLQAKLDESERAAAEVEAFEERLQQLTTIHHTVGESINWNEIVAELPPTEPQKSQQREDAAVRTRNEFKPNVWQRLFGGEKKVRLQLDQAIVEAKQRDEVSYQGALKLYRQQFEQWQESNRLAAAIINGDTTAYQKALEELEPLSEMKEVGCEFGFSFPDGRTAEVSLTVEGEKVVPREHKSLTRAGKLSEKPIPKGKYYELYQDYVCGCVLRIGRELFSFLPLTRVIVNVNAVLLDPSTGHVRSQPILSVGMPRPTLGGMNFTSVDPSEAMALFQHRMGFKRSQGFYPIAPLTPQEYPAA